MILTTVVAASLLTVTPVAVTVPITASSPPSASTVIATTSIWTDIVDQLDCHDHFTVESLVPTGADPHAYEPSLADADRLAAAALVVANGSGLEESLGDTVAAAGERGTAVVTVTDFVDTLDGDPHIWLDPTLVIATLDGLVAALVNVGGDDTELTECAAVLTASLTELDTAIAAELSEIPDDERLLVTNHDALGYFARRYSFEVIGTVLPSTSTLTEASPAELDELAATIDAAGVPAIFAEHLDNNDAATTLGERLGVAVVSLYTDTLPGDEHTHDHDDDHDHDDLDHDDHGAGRYQQMMSTNAELIADALG